VKLQLKFKILIALGLIIILVVILKPSDNGAPYDPYFRKVNEELRLNGPGRPVLVLDCDRLDRNLEIMMNYLKPPLSFRLVVKSLPSLPLMRYILQKTGSRKVMVFHQPDMNLLARSGLRDVDMLLGKPMPINAVREFYREKTPGDFRPSQQVQWLIDTPERLNQYLQFARERGEVLRINIEIDVGLHRGGVDTLATLEKMLAVLAARKRHLRFSGFMGYEAHIAAVPVVFADKREAIRSALNDVLGKYRAFVNYGKERYPELFQGELTLNAGGSTTYVLYKDQDLINDIALGSAIVKPMGFDTVLLEDHIPALFIATPVLKKMKGTTIPFIEGASPLFSLWNPNKQNTYFIYGGGWLAQPFAPAGLESNALYGFSTNQAFINGSDRTDAGVDDYIFFRPTQSERIMQEFGDLLILRNKRIVDSWPVFPTE